MAHIPKTYDFDTPSEYTYDSSSLSIASGVAKLINLDTPTDFIEDFNDTAGLTFNSSLIEIVGGANAALKLIDDSQIFNQTFSSSVGFSFNAANTEFTGGLVRQIDQYPEMAVGGSFISFNLDWTKEGSITGTNNGASLVGGKLECSGPNKYVYWNNAAISACSTLVSLKFKYTPLYSGSPVTNVNMAIIKEVSGNNNKILLYHSSGGFISFSVYDIGGVGISVSTPFPTAFTPTLGVEYEILFEIDSITGTAYCFVDGVSLSDVAIGAYSRTNTATYLQIGSSSTYVQSNARFDDVILFNDIQETVGYVPGYTVPVSIYYGDVITFPTFTYSGIGNIQEFTNIVSTETNAPRYIINGLYYSGGWVASSDDWATASSLATILANIATLPASDTVIIKLVTNDSTVLMSVDDLTITYDGQIYPTSDPTIDIDATISPTVSGATLTAINTFVSTVTIAGSDNVKFAISNDDGSNYFYYNGATWQASTGYATSSTNAEITAGLSTFPLIADAIKIRIYLHSDSGLTTPSIGNLTVNYNDYIYSILNPTIIPTSAVETDSLDDFIETSTITGSDNIKYAINIEGIDYYHDGIEWATSSGYAQTNTAAEILIRIPSLNTFIGDNIVTLYPKIYIHSDDGSTTPILDEVEFEYSHVPIVIDTYNICSVWGYLKDIRGDDVHSHEPIFVQLNKRSVRYADYTVVEGCTRKIKPKDGRFEIDLLDTENMTIDGDNDEDDDIYYIFTIRGVNYRKYIPAQSSANFWELDGPEDIDE